MHFASIFAAFCCYIHRVLKENIFIVQMKCSVSHEYHFLSHSPDFFFCIHDIFLQLGPGTEVMLELEVFVSGFFRPIMSLKILQCRCSCSMHSNKIIKGKCH